jgi:DNA-directed RNA polymerase II subunit RPB2
MGSVQRLKGCWFDFSSLRYSLVLWGNLKVYRERDSLITHGTASFIKERLFDMSDPYKVIVCKKCGGFCSKVDECRACNDDSIVEVQIPYACKLLLQELNAMGIKTQISVKE